MLSDSYAEDSRLNPTQATAFYVRRITPHSNDGLLKSRLNVQLGELYDEKD